jgi:histidine phosphotransfer protein HptB
VVDSVPAIDTETLVALLDAVGGEQAILEDLALTFLADIDEQLNELRRGIGAQDAPVVRRAAHSLKSTGASFGATRLAGACKEVEASTESGALPPESVVDGLTSEANLVKAQLLPAIASIGAPG